MLVRAKKDILPEYKIDGAVESKLLQRLKSIQTINQRVSAMNTQLESGVYFKSHSRLP